MKNSFKCLYFVPGVSGYMRILEWICLLKFHTIIVDQILIQKSEI
jgi:hypothetical protein